MSEQRVAAGVILPCLSALRYLHAKVGSHAFAGWSSRYYQIMRLL